MTTTETGSAAPASLSSIAGLRILGACDNYTATSSGGAEKAAHEVYRRLGAAGAHLRVLSVPHGTPYADPGVEVVPARGVDLSSFVGGYLGLSPHVFLLARRESAAFAPDALHAHTIHYNATVAVAREAARLGLPFVLTAHLGPTTEMPALTRVAAAAYERTVGRYIVRRATRILAVSSTVREHMIDLGAPAERVEVVENGVDHERFAAPPLEPRPDPLLLYVGRIVDNKGPHLLVDAAIALAARGHRVRVAFLGDGPSRRELEGRIAAAGLTDTVRFVGQVPDVERWLRDADIVVRPSFTEGLPLAVLEAMAAGRCNVVSDIPPNRELIEDGVTGLTFRTGDASDLADVLARAVGDADLRMRLAEGGRVASLSRSWERTAAQTAAALVDVVRSVRR